ncbi:MAG: 4Fe-4S dicluster domain-containing protein [Nitriliruptorales bacterium]|nr:4Fe-4S dicluster domain-containing protein [Nitriliruptorales bacterium]
MELLPLHPSTARTESPPSWVKVIDQTKCIGCHACTTACKSENDVPVGVSRTYVKAVDVGTFPEARRAFQVTRCNQCVDAPCVTACPTSAMYKRPDGIVDFDKESCIGCKACIAACPYDAIFINPEDHSAEKCNFCAHRLDVGLEPACVTVCPVEAILVGDQNDPLSSVGQIVGRGVTQVRRPEKDTSPKLFYKGATSATLDPLAATLPPGGIFAWAQQPETDGHHINSGAPEGHATSAAAAILAYDVPHNVPWDWRVGLYTWTKSIAAGVYLVAAILVLLGVLGTDSTLWRWTVPVASLTALGVTGVVLIADLEHPGRFYYIFTRAQWGSWLVRGGVIIGLYGGVLALHLLGSLLGTDGLASGLMVPGIPLAVMTAVYTAFLFAQAKARDLWQNPLLPPHFAVQAGLAGASVLAVLAAAENARILDALGWAIAVTAGLHLLMIAGEVTLPHVTAHAKLATHHLVRGRFATLFWIGVATSAVALAAPVVPIAPAVIGLIGLLAFEHAYVQAGQSVPLA